MPEAPSPAPGVEEAVHLGNAYHLRAGRRHLAATCSGEPGCVSVPETD